MVVASHEGELELRYLELFGPGNDLIDTSGECIDFKYILVFLI